VSARRWTALVAALCLGPIAPAAADTPPTAWDRAQDPATRDRWALHVRVQRLLYPMALEEGPDDARRNEELRLEIARSLLEEVDAAHSPDPRLRFDLGIVYEKLSDVRRTSELHQKVIDILVPALTDAPDADGSTDALEQLVYAYAKLDRPKDEIAIWRRYIPRLLDDRARMAPMMNLGEAQMRLGRLDEALATFQATLQLCMSLPSMGSVNATIALTKWDQAVALDRSGDAGQALAIAKEARDFKWIELVGGGAFQTSHAVTGWDAIQDQATVFFVPEWERDWYLALGYAAAARATTNVRESAHLWAQSEAHWGVYVRHAESGSSKDRWLAIARLRLEHARDERLAMERAAAKLPPPLKPDVTIWSDP
jgi:tetratricopeptide (TPR) repeat protein